MKLSQDIDYADVAKLISNNHIVAIFQGRSEAGPRALGNRSILFDPRLLDGHLYINKIKGREWYRPVAGTILEENFDDYFITNGLKNTPFMSYAVKIKSDNFKEKVPCIVHTDKTCRIQTVNKEQNYHYYNLISAFKNITRIPLIGNTSFNLGGEPIVETIRDALDVIQRSEIEYLYLPELRKLVFSENN
jgi:carbamoyltransferase